MSPDDTIGAFLFALNTPQTSMMDGPMTDSFPFKAIIFDCDGVLVDSEVLGLADTVAYLKNHGFSWEAPDLIRKFTGYRDDVFRAMLEDAYQDLHQAPAPSHLFEGLVETRRARKDELQAIRGAREIIQKLNQYNIPIAVASSSRGVYLERKLKHTHLWDLIAPHIYSAERVANGKPAPDIFLYAAHKININPSECLVIEDSAQGVIAGCNAQMTVWGFIGGGHCFEGHGQRLKEAGANETFESFDLLQAQIFKSL